MRDRCESKQKDTTLFAERLCLAADCAHSLKGDCDVKKRQPDAAATHAPWGIRVGCSTCKSPSSAISCWQRIACYQKVVFPSCSVDYFLRSNRLPCITNSAQDPVIFGLRRRCRTRRPLLDSYHNTTVHNSCLSPAKRDRRSQNPHLLIGLPMLHRPRMYATPLLYRTHLHDGCHRASQLSTHPIRHPLQRGQSVENLKLVLSFL